MPTKKVSKNFQFYVITLITLTSVLGITSVPPAFPAIAEYFNVPINKIGILMGVFTMPGIILTPIFGFLADKYSRQVILIPSLLIFAAAGFACAFSNSFEMLLIFRTLQGVGTASLGSLNISLIGDIFEKNQIGKYAGLNNMVLSFGTALFPVIGGVLTLISWNTVFYLPLFSVLVVVFYIIAFKDTKSKSQNITIKKIVSGFKDKEFRKLSLFNILSYVLVIGSVFTYLPFHLKYNYNMTSKDTGIYLFIMSLAAAFSAIFLDKLIKAISEKGILKLQFLIFAIVTLLIPFLTPTTIYIAVIFYGAAYGVSLPSMQYWILQISNSENRASFTSIHRAISQLGQTIGPITFGFIASSLSLANSVDEIFYFGAGLALFSLILSIFILTNNSNINKGVSNV